MQCRYCGKKIPDDAIFCPSCGKRLESHLRAEDRAEYKYKKPDDQIESKGKRRGKALISILAAIAFVAAVFIAIMVFAKPYLGEDAWPDKKNQPVQEEETAAPVNMYVTAEDGLIMRKEPGEDKEAVHILNYGQEIEVEKTEEGWVYASADGIKGWCSAEHLTDNKDEIKQKETKTADKEDRSHLVEPSVRIESGQHWKVDSEGGLNLRCGPGAEYDILMVVPDKTEVVEEGRTGEWTFIRYDGEYGWISSRYLIPFESN